MSRSEYSVVVFVLVVFVVERRPDDVRRRTQRALAHGKDVLGRSSTSTCDDACYTSAGLSNCVLKIKRAKEAKGRERMGRKGEGKAEGGRGKRREGRVL